MGDAAEAAADAPSFRLCIVVVADVAGIGVMTTVHRPPNAVRIAPLHPPAYPADFVTCRHRHSMSVGEGQGRAGEVESTSLALLSACSSEEQQPNMNQVECPGKPNLLPVCLMICRVFWFYVRFGFSRFSTLALFLSRCCVTVCSSAVFLGVT